MLIYADNLPLAQYVVNGRRRMGREHALRRIDAGLGYMEHRSDATVERLPAGALIVGDRLARELDDGRVRLLTITDIELDNDQLVLHLGESTRRVVSSSWVETICVDAR